jgi:glycosyltransferase involved in cell wall biosynthesis
MTDLLGDDCNPAGATASPDINASPQQPDPDFEELLQLFLDQAWPIRSIVALGYHQLCGQTGPDARSAHAIGVHNEAFLLRIVATRDSSPAITRIPLQRSWRNPGAGHAYTLDSLARQARELSRDAPGNDLLLSPAHTLNEMMTPLVDDFSFRAVVALSSRPSGRPHDGDFWNIRRTLFDHGLICIGSVQVTGCKALCFLASDAVRLLRRCDVGSRGHVTISQLANKSGFANQLFRYAYVKLYALRHGLTAAFPEWEGNQLFGLDDESCAGQSFRRLTFNGFTDHDRLLWERDDPPIDIDLNGYFQEIPACWQRHRPLLRRLFQLPLEHQNAIDTWRHDATRGGQRTLVAIHVRRGDYRNLQLQDMPWFRLVPEGWYLDWLRTIWPTLRDPLLFVATDEPDAMLPVFREFEIISAKFGATAQLLPDHVRDFEILRRADYLAICNSSFSRMAAILAPSTQKSFLASFQTQRFVSYEPWIDPAFWARFAGAWCATLVNSEHGRQPALTANSRNAFDPLMQTTTIYFEISDLLLYLMNHATLSGIQRVQCEILCHLADMANPQAIRFVVLNDVGGFGEIDKSALLNIIEYRRDARSTADMASELRALLSRAMPCGIRPGDILLTIGAFWAVSGMGRLLQKLKNSGVVIGVFIHDILPITAPEYFEARDTRVFVRGVVEALTFADFILTTSEYNEASLAKHMAAQRMDPLPVHLVPLARELANTVPIEFNVSSVVAGIISKDYVLCVGTIEVRKNPTYLFNIWNLMVRSGRTNIPTLVFAGRKGWLVQDFMNQLKACNYLDGRIVLLHDVTDAELDLLYRKCMLTMFPSFAEGWGLPVGESLAHGKITICSAVGGIPEVGGKLLDYLVPYNAGGGLELMLRYLDDPELRRSREREIACHFKPRSWRQVAEDFLRSTQALARQVRPYEGVAAIKLPPERFLPISADAAAISMDVMDGAASAELACISGWWPPQMWGVRAGEAAATLRFRPDAPVGTRLNLVMRLAVHGSGFCCIRICSGSGAETEASIKGGSDSMAVLSCEVEPGQLITARLSLAGPFLDPGEVPDAPYWSLKGFLYFEPKRLAGEASKELMGGRAPRSHSTKPLTPPLPVNQPDRREHVPPAKRILLPSSAPWDDRQCATSFGAFLQGTDSYWRSDFANNRDAPIFADRSDRQIFYSGCGNHALAPRVGEITDSIKLIRRSNQFVSMSRFTEGSVFDRSGVWRARGYLQTSPPAIAPWLSSDVDGLWVDGESLAAAPWYEKSYLIFYNGNLHNYYHWLVEGLLSLDVLSRALGRDSNLKIALPKSMDIDAVFDHRESLRALGFDRHNVVEVAANLIKVQEAIWVDSDLVQSMPAPYLKDFQQRVAARYASLSSPRSRRLLVARKGPRKIHNIEQVQAFLSRYDFETVCLEGMSIVDQILLFQSAEFVIGPHGAGLSNLVFCEPGTKVIEFMPSVELRPFFWLISEKLDLVHGMQFCTPVGGQGFQAAVTVDIGKLKALFRMVDAHL